MRRWIIRMSIAMTPLVVVALAMTWWVVKQTQRVPEFYTEATRSLPESTAEASRHLKAEVEQLQSAASKTGSWQASFSDDEINAWLVEELPKKFPQLLAKGASEPRIAIEDDRLLAAVKYKNRRIDTIISAEFQVELTEQPNILALRVSQLRAGALPLPLNKFLKGITKEAAKGDIEIRWDVTEAGPVALVTVPSEHPGYVSSPVVVESIRLVDGSLDLSGHTGPMAQASYKPRGPVHRFVSYQPGEKRSRQPSRLSSRRRPSAEKLR